MNRRQKPIPPRIKNSAYRPAIERLDAALAENTLSDNYEKIRLMRVALFADVDALRESGKIVLPE
jgi:hypothetical protein